MAIKPDGVFKVESIDMIQRTIHNKNIPLYSQEHALDSEGKEIVLPTANFKGSQVFSTKEDFPTNLFHPLLAMTQKSMAVEFTTGLGIWTSVPDKFPKPVFNTNQKLPISYRYEVRALAGKSIDIPLIATDPFGSSFTYTITTPPTSGTTAIKDSVLTYTNEEGTPGVYVIEYTATNFFGSSNPGRIVVNVVSQIR